MKRLLPLALLAVFLLGACGDTDRPEGVVERWLISLNQGRAGEPRKYAPESLSQRILPHWESRDPGDLDVIEVGKASLETGIFNRGGDEILRIVFVPFRAELASGREIEASAEVKRGSADWRITSIRPRDPRALVPSEGGNRIGGASAGTWAIAAGISALLMLLVAFAIRLTPKPMALPTGGTQKAGP